MGAAHKTGSKKDRLAARLTRGSQPGRRRVEGKRFSTDDQPKRPRGRPKGSPNLITRQVKEAILLGLSELGEDLQGKGGLVGFVKRVGRYDLKTAAMLLRAVMPTQVTIEEKQEIVYQSVDQARADLQRAGIPSDDLFKLLYLEGPLVTTVAMDVTDDGAEAHDPKLDDK